MCFWLVILGAWMGWIETVYGDKQADIPEIPVDSASYLGEPDMMPDIPPMFRRDKEAEATAKKADVYVRYMGAKR